MTGDSLDRLYEEAHVAVGSLGCHRKRLPVASELKAREYACKGMPFIAALQDPDFPDDIPFVLRAAADETSINIRKVLNWYEGLAITGMLNSMIREYAELKLDFSKKVWAFEFNKVSGADRPCYP